MLTSYGFACLAFVVLAAVACADLSNPVSELVYDDLFVNIVSEMLDEDLFANPVS